MNSDSDAPVPEYGGRKKRKQKRGIISVLIRLSVCVVFVLGIYGSMRLGISMASNRLPESDDRGKSIRESVSFSAGGTEDPVYLSTDPDILRSFFIENPTPSDRADANLTGKPIRRISEELRMTTIRVEADTVEVKLSSGAIAGAVYWIHYSQVPGPEDLDPIISPVPTQKP